MSMWSVRRHYCRGAWLFGLLLSMLMLLPGQAEAQSLLDAARADGHYHWFLRAVRETELEKALSQLSAVTLLAPTDAAFEAMDEEERSKLFSLRNRDRLLDVLNLHIIERDLSLNQALQIGMVGSRQGQALHFETRGDSVTVNGAKVDGAIAHTAQGRLYGLNQVLLPSL